MTPLQHINAAEECIRSARHALRTWKDEGNTHRRAEFFVDVAEAIKHLSAALVGASNG